MSTPEKKKPRPVPSPSDEAMLRALGFSRAVVWVHRSTKAPLMKFLDEDMDRKLHGKASPFTLGQETDDE